MYIVMEIQKNGDGTIATLVTTYESKNEAENKYYTILAYAAISNLPLHGAVMLHETGSLIKSDSFTHAQPIE